MAISTTACFAFLFQSSYHQFPSVVRDLHQVLQAHALVGGDCVVSGSLDGGGGRWRDFWFVMYSF